MGQMKRDISGQRKTAKVMMIDKNETGLLGIIELKSQVGGKGRRCIVLEMNWF